MKNYFYGWYMKCQSEEQTLAVIPAVHCSKDMKSCSIQIITENDLWNFTYPIEQFHREKKQIFIEKNQFGKDGIFLSIQKENFL